MHRAFSVLHLQIFYQWLQLPLERQIAAVDRYLRTGEGTPSAEGLIRRAQFFAPRSAALPERQLFEADLSIVLTLLQVSRKVTEQGERSGLWRLAAAAQVFKTQPNRVKVTLRKLGEHPDVSPNHLGRLFRQRSGISCQRYMLLARMAMAAALMRSTPLTVNQVAQKVGYTDASNFCRDFHKAFGKSPSNYQLQISLDGINSPHGEGNT